MASLFAFSFLVVVSLLVDASTMVSPTPKVDKVSEPQEGALSSDCPSCSLSQLSRNSSLMGGQSDMVEAVKRHILNMLHLSARPNLTQPIPRAALLNAIKKLHVGHVTKDGSVEIQEVGQGHGASASPEPPSEIITFAEAVKSSNFSRRPSTTAAPLLGSLDGEGKGDSPNTVTFDLLKEGGTSSVVEQANVWIFVKMSKGNQAKSKVTLRLLQLHLEDDEEECVSEKMLDTHRSGWHTLAIPHSVQTLFDSGGSSLSLQVSCPLCARTGASLVLTPSRDERAAGRDQSHRPFLMVALRAREEAMQRRVKRGLECDGKIHICCKRQFYVNFKDIGWSDWIIAPSGYHANYCEGDCPNHMVSLSSSSLSFHSTVISHYRMRGYSPFQNIKSCCIPTRLRAMSMLYYNEEQKIIKKDIQNMIVEECGCS